MNTTSASIPLRSERASEEAAQIFVPIDSSGEVRETVEEIRDLVAAHKTQWLDEPQKRAKLARELRELIAGAAHASEGQQFDVVAVQDGVLDEEGLRGYGKYIPRPTHSRFFEQARRKHATREINAVARE